MNITSESILREMLLWIMERNLRVDHQVGTFHNVTGTQQSIDEIIILINKLS